MPDTLKQRIQDDVKSAMRAKDKERLGVLRMTTAAIKQREIDERTSLDDAGILSVLDKMIKQRRDALGQFTAAGRNDLADQEAFEIAVLDEYMPTALTETELNALIEAALTKIGASSLRDMGNVMKLLSPEVRGRADMGAVSGRVKERLSSQ